MKKDNLIKNYIKNNSEAEFNSKNNAKFNKLEINSSCINDKQKISGIVLDELLINEISSNILNFDNITVNKKIILNNCEDVCLKIINSNINEIIIKNSSLLYDCNFNKIEKIILENVNLKLGSSCELNKKNQNIEYIGKVETDVRNGCFLTNKQKNLSLKLGKLRIKNNENIVNKLNEEQLKILKMLKNEDETTEITESFITYENKKISLFIKYDDLVFNFYGEIFPSKFLIFKKDKEYIKKILETFSLIENLDFYFYLNKDKEKLGVGIVNTSSLDRHFLGFDF